jgi:alcohol dehydrogenase class IV
MTSSALLELRKFVAPEFVFGPGAAGLAGQYAANLRAGKALLVTDQGLIRHSWATLVSDSLQKAGINVVRFDALSANPRDHEVMAGAALYQRAGCDCIVAVGGGSPMDCAKAIGIVNANEQHVLEFEGADNVAKPGPPLICIPTTAGSAAEVSQFCIITDSARKVKIAIVSKTMVPDVALIDPVLTTTMDRDLTAHTGLDALTHAIEAYVSNAHSPITDLHARETVRLVARHLPRAIEEPDNIEVRAGMLLGSLFAGLAFSNAILGAVHALAHSLGGFLDLPHGQCNAILLDHVIDFNYDAAPDRYEDIGRLLGGDIPSEALAEERKSRVLETVRAFKRKCGVTATLSELGVRPEDLADLAAKAVRDPCMITNPKDCSVEDVCRIYEHACK